MIKTYLQLLVGCATLFCLPAKAQSPDSSTALYVAVHAGSPLFWGDFSSTAEKLRLGYGGGLSLGYQLNKWMATELDVNFMKGRLDANKWQTNDLLDDNGVIRYTKGNFKASSVYSKTTVLQVGLRLPISVFRLFDADKKFNIAIAPHIYLNKFNPGIYAVETNKKVTDGAKATTWSYSAGGDIGFSYKLAHGKAIFLQSALSWLSDDKFEGLTTEPAWRDNLMLYTRIGIRFNLGKKKNGVAPTPIQSTVAVASPKKEEVVEVTNPSQPLVNQPNSIEKTQEKQKDTNPNELLSPIYFKLNKATIDETEHAEILNRMLQLANLHPQLPILIEGWSDTSGPVAFNNSLAQQRAEALASYLIQQGVDQKRIQVVGKGSDKQLGASAKARRAELKFIINP